MMNLLKLPPGAWQATNRSRFVPLPEREKSLVQKTLMLITRMRTGTDRTLNVFEMLARLQGTFFPYLLFFSNLLFRGAIPRADKERIVLRVAWRCGCIYEWGHHVKLARDVGVRDDQINAIAEPVSPLWSARTATLMHATDELIETRTISDATWTALRQELSENEIVEFCMIVGHYVMVAGTVNAMGVRLEPGYLK